MNYQSPILISELQNILVERCRKNPAYSLRTFAKSLALSPSYLSQIISGKRGFSAQTAEKILDHLDLDKKSKIKIFKELNGEMVNQSIESKYKKVDVDLFEEISDWYYYAILSLIETKDFKADVRWIAARLNVPLAIIKDAIHKLSKLNLLDTTNEQWKQKIPPIKVDNKYSTAATRKYQKNLIQKALESLENDPYEVRDATSCTMAIDPSLLPEARRRISLFRRKLMEDLESLSKSNQTEVYNLQLQFYPCTKVREK